jgi:hypothetical protein
MNPSLRRFAGAATLAAGVGVGVRIVLPRLGGRRTCRRCATGPPITYMFQGKQYVVLAIGSQQHLGEFVALALP